MASGRAVRHRRDRPLLMPVLLLLATQPAWFLPHILLPTTVCVQRVYVHNFNATVSKPAVYALCRHHYSSLALHDTKVIAALISISPPKAFTTVLPSLMSASVALVVIFSVITWSVYAYRALQQYQYSSTRSFGSPRQLKMLAITTGFANTLLYILVIWFMVMFAFSLLWAGGGMIASKATMDGANTLSVVDETLPKLIRAALGIDPAKLVSSTQMQHWCES